MRHRSMLGSGLLCAVVFALSAKAGPIPSTGPTPRGAGEAATEGEAALEIDQRLAHLAEPTSEVELVFDPLQDSKFQLRSASFALDHNTLPFDLKAPSAPLFRGKLPAGPHDVTVNLVYSEAKGGGFFEYTGYDLTVTGTVKVLAQNGLHSRVHVTVERHEPSLPKQRLSIGTRVESEMLAKIDDSPVVLASRQVTAPTTAGPAQRKPAPAPRSRPNSSNEELAAAEVAAAPDPIQVTAPPAPSENQNEPSPVAAPPPSDPENGIGLRNLAAVLVIAAIGIGALIGLISALWRRHRHPPAAHSH